jgi:hypothetical protein
MSILYFLSLFSYLTTIKNSGLQPTRRFEKAWAYVLSTRQQEHTIETIHNAIVELWKQFPKAGAQDMMSLLFHCKEMSASRYV